MSEIAVQHTGIASMSQSAIDRARALEQAMMTLPQEELTTHHLIHGGMYARTIKIPAGMVLTGALIKIATTLIVVGDVKMFVDDGVVELSGYNVLPASANRKQAFVTESDTYLTMIFPSRAQTVEQAESEFTNEVDLLVSRRDPSRDTITITGD